jgi:hypothetical protein
MLGDMANARGSYIHASAAAIIMTASVFRRESWYDAKIRSVHKRKEATPPVPPWSSAGANVDIITGYNWELYAPTDFSEADDLAKKMPEKLQEMQLLFYTEAAKYGVLPLDNSKTSRMGPGIRLSLTEGRKSFTFYDGQKRITEGASPDVMNRSWSITTDVDLKADTSGMLITQAGLFAGWALYFDKGKPVFHYNFLDVAHYDVAGKDGLAPGKHIIKMDFVYDGGGVGKGGIDAPFSSCSIETRSPRARLRTAEQAMHCKHTFIYFERRTVSQSRFRDLTLDRSKHGLASTGVWHGRSIYDDAVTRSAFENSPNRYVCGYRRTDGDDRRRRRERAGPIRRGDGAARCRRANHGDRVD